MTFLVQIRYREPSYERRHGSKPEPYRARFTVAASDETEACRLAMSEFRHVEALSSVGWRREVVNIAAVCAEPESTAVGTGS